MDRKKARELYDKYKRDYMEFYRGNHVLPADVDEAFKPYLQAANEKGFVLYDVWPAEKANPKVVFILDPRHNYYEEEIASLVEAFMGQGLLSNEDCVLIEGPSGSLDYNCEVSAGKEKFYFGVKENNRLKSISHPLCSYLEMLYEKFKQGNIPVIFDDNLRLCKEIGRLSHRIGMLEKSLQKQESEAQNDLLENSILELMQHMFTRSENHFTRGIRENQYMSHVFQIFGFADYAIEHAQKRLREDGISYAAFMPGRYKDGKK